MSPRRAMAGFFDKTRILSFKKTRNLETRLFLEALLLLPRLQRLE